MRPVPFMLDTSCMVAAICSWHDHHDRALDEIEARLDRKEQMTVAAPSLIEAYSVLTRLPVPHRIAPAQAMTLIHSNFVRGVKLVALPATAYTAMLQTAPDANISGGRIYDAVIAACAREAKVRTLLTFNEEDFASIAGSDLEIVVP